MIRRCHKEIPHEDVKINVVAQYAMMLARVSEFTVGEMDAEDLPDALIDPHIAQSGKCSMCGRFIAEYEEKFEMTFPTGLYKCIDCYIKEESQ